MSDVVDPPVVGYWRTLWHHRREVFVSWDLALSGVVAIVSAAGLRDSSIEVAFANLLIAEVAGLAAVLGIVIAGLAIVASQLSPAFVLVLSRTRAGVAADFFPFWHLTVVLVAGIIGAGAAYLVLPQSTALQARILVGVTSFLSVYGLLAAVNLVAFIVGQGVNRALQVLRDERE